VKAPVSILSDSEHGSFIS